MSVLARQLGAELRRETGPVLVGATLVLALVAILASRVTDAYLPGAAFSALVPRAAPQLKVCWNYAYVLEIGWTLAAALPALVLSADVSDDVRAVTLTFPVGPARLILLRAAAGLAWPLAWLAGGLAFAELLGMPLPFVRDLAMLAPEELFVFGLVLAATEASGQPVIGAAALVGAMAFAAGLPGDPLPQRSDYWELFCARGHLAGPLLWDNRLVLLGLAALLVVAALGALTLKGRRGTYAP